MQPQSRAHRRRSRLLVRAALVAGTGRFEGIEGDYAFQWTDWTTGDVERTVQGHSDNVKGRYRLP